MNVIEIKRGDTFLLKGTYKQNDGTILNLTGASVEVNIINSTTDKSVATIVSGNGSSDRSLTVTPGTGEFILVVKDTENFKNDDYWVDFKTTSASGYEQTSKALKLKLKTKLV